MDGSQVGLGWRAALRARNRGGSDFLAFVSNFQGFKPKISYLFSLDTTATSQDQASDDEDDELLALRIAALESIKIKEAKVAWSYPPLYNMCSISGKGRC